MQVIYFSLLVFMRCIGVLCCPILALFIKFLCFDKLWLGLVLLAAADAALTSFLPYLNSFSNSSMPPITRCWLSPNVWCSVAVAVISMPSEFLSPSCETIALIFRCLVCLINYTKSVWSMNLDAPGLIGEDS